MDERSVNWLRNSLEKKFTIHQWRGIQFKELDVNGFMSTIWLAYLDWDGDNLPNTVIIKKPKKIITVPALWKEQCNEFSDKLLTLLTKTESKVYNLFQSMEPPIPLPHIYDNYEINNKNNAEILLIMEDLSEYKVIDIAEGLNDEQIYAVTNAIAKFHAYSITNNQWKSVGLGRYEKSEIEGMEKFSKIIQIATSEVKKENPKCFPKSDVLFRILLEFLGEDWYENYITKCNYEEVLSTLVHGDLWSANLLWCGNNLRAIIDWQMAHCGSITEDLLHLLSTSVNVERRRKLTQSLLKYYYGMLKSLLDESGVEITFSFEDLMINYHETILITAAKMMFATTLWSNSKVLCNGTSEVEARIQEMFHRADSITEDAIESYNILKK